MKRFILSLILLAITQLALQESFAQSQSFQTFKNKFAGEDDVHCFKVSGFIVRSVLGMAGEHEAKEAVRGIHRVRLAVVPRDAFNAQKVSVNGFRRILHEDNFDEMMSFRENGDHVTVYSNSPRHDDEQCYLMLVESDEEVVLIEVLGNVNETYFKNLVKIQSQRT
ncbi:DUF4252 domain-containing protein [Chryseolinea sp. T2]|uniref:DUF4252 domain-containing protein n=1 Tax=Chryseolinea sp. T2 TaxID=3129255 RepID=UPI00307879E8